ncbi:MAG: alpha/beta hydrolase [Betaproteobacteria bacterium]|nr:alpha/beta hydrolase [Betaproteobacteria bacterium]
MKRARRRLIGIGSLSLAALVVWSLTVFHRDMAAAYRNVEGRCARLAAPLGDIEYARGGTKGVTVLVIHGSGGGCDQGTLLASALLPEDQAWVAPSRFGYLGSAVPAGATFATQADAYARLLDQLRLARVAVVAFSHGGPSALEFATRHPDRVSALILVSAGVAASADAEQSGADFKGWMLMQVFQHDFAYWAVTRAFRGAFMRLMGADPAVVSTLNPAQRELVDRVIDGMNPVSRRAAGTRFDHTAAMPDARIRAIRAPTLIVHAEDDRLQLFHNAAFAMRHIEGARLLKFAHGGHLVFSVEQVAIRSAIEAALTDEKAGRVHDRGGLS